MRLRSFFLGLLLLALAVAAAAGWAWGAREHGRYLAAEQRNADADFVRQRMAFLEGEGERLRNALKTRQETDGLTASRARRKEIESQVENLRALKFLQPVTYKEIPRADLPSILRQKLAQQVPDQEFEDSGAALTALGLLPPGMDLKKTYLALLGEQIGAFYDQHEKQLFTFSGQSLDEAQNRVIMAHELTHALEDQHFQLANLPIEAKGNDDRALASTALVEGDATLVMNQYMVGDLSAASLRDSLASAFSTDVRQLAAAPRYLRETLLFPYLRGQEFCQAVYAARGWEGLAEAFRQPPSSTAQILHPELFLARPRVEPVSIDFGAADVLGQKPIDENVLGEFGARQVFLVWLHDEQRASDVAAGWRGDRYAVYRQDGGVSYVWKVACRDRATAEKFYEAVRDANTTRYGQQQLMEKKSFPVRRHDGTEAEAATVLSTTFSPAGREVKIAVTSANEMIVIDAQDARWSGALSEKFAPQNRFPTP